MGKTEFNKTGCRYSFVGSRELQHTDCGGNSSRAENERVTFTKFVGRQKII